MSSTLVTSAPLCGFELLVDEPPFVQASRSYAENTCCNNIFQVLRCFGGMFIDIAKINRDAAHVAMAMHVCFKYMFQMFHLQTKVASIFV
jgi:hypothetical protein